jgi:hypothetical protein
MRPIALGVLSVLVAHTATAYSTVSSQSPGTDTRASGAGSEVPGQFGLRLAVDPLPQVLQLNRRLCHPAPASHVVQGLPPVGRLRSTGITPPPRYCTPIRHPLAFGPLPGVAGYRASLAPGISPRGETGFSSCLARPCPHAVATHPAEVAGSSRSAFDPPCCLRLRVAGSAFGATHFRGHHCVHCCYGLGTRHPPKKGAVDRLQDLGLPPSCDPSYGASDSYPGRTVSC